MTINLDQFFVKRSKLQGRIKIPPSKSHTLRALLFATLGKGKSIIRCCLDSPDTGAMIAACRLFGAVIEVFPDRLEIEGVDGAVQEVQDTIDAGNSGIVLRFCSAVAALSRGPVVVTGDPSVQKRPMQELLSGLKQLGCRVDSLHGFAPVRIEGPILGGSATISGEDSQPVSALLIAAAFAEHPVEIHVKNPGEKPWAALTLDWLNRLAIPYEQEGFHYYRLFGKSRYSGLEYTVPGDLSSLAFPVAAALITQSELAVENVDMEDAQGDKELIAVFQKMGAEMEMEGKTLYVKPCRSLKGISVDVNDFIDGLPILAVLACFAEGETHIYNGKAARKKECDRISCMAKELRKMGADVSEGEDGLKIRKSSLRGANVDSYSDHRMAMSLAVAAMGAAGETMIGPVACVSKTFSSFLSDFVSMGADISYGK
jgi:3-phosphoshikimate 1-carboxyvinyltransferase